MDPRDLHWDLVRTAALPQPQAVEARLEFEAVYRQAFDEVVRWIRSLGGAQTEVEDLAQEVFLIVRRQLPRFDGGNLRGWLFRITHRVVRDHRRSAWFRRVFARPREVDLEGAADPARLPDEALAQAERARRARAVINRLSEKRRIAFVLFELEGYSGEEISSLLELPLATVWTRLHHARKEFLEKLATLERELGEDAP